MSAPQTVYIGVDVPAGRAVFLAGSPSWVVTSLPVIEGWVSPEQEGVIELALGGDPEAKLILLDSVREPVLGWTFVEGER